MTLQEYRELRSQKVVEPIVRILPLFRAESWPDLYDIPPGVAFTDSVGDVGLIRRRDAKMTWVRIHGNLHDPATLKWHSRQEQSQRSKPYVYFCEEEDVWERLK